LVVVALVWIEANSQLIPSDAHDWWCVMAANEVSDGSQPPMTLDLSLSETAGSRSLHHLGRHS
jgi:hypothetical protein